MPAYHPGSPGNSRYFRGVRKVYPRRRRSSRQPELHPSLFRMLQSYTHSYRSENPGSNRYFRGVPPTYLPQNLPFQEQPQPLPDQRESPQCLPAFPLSAMLPLLSQQPLQALPSSPRYNLTVPVPRFHPADRTLKSHPQARQWPPADPYKYPQYCQVHFLPSMPQLQL